MNRLLPSRRARASALSAIVVFLAASPARAQVTHIDLAPDGSIVAVDSGRDEVLRIDPATGTVEKVSSATIGGGPLLDFAWSVAVAPDGSALVSGYVGSRPGILRVDPTSGDRTVFSEGAPFQSNHNPIAIAADGTVFVADQRSALNAEPRILRVDPSTGERTVISGAGIGGGPPIGLPTGLAIEPGGSLIWTDASDNSVMRVDPDSGDRTVVSSKATGSGRRLGFVEDVDVASDSTVLTVDTVRPVLCLPLCPHPLCLYCLMNGPTVFAVDPVDGDRTIVTGGGTALVAGDGTVLTPFFGRTGRGPDLDFPHGVRAESPESCLVANWGQVLRVNTRTGRRELVASLSEPDARAGAASRRQDRRQGLSSLEPRRIHRPREPEAWLRRALGDAAGEVNLRRPERLLEGLSPARARVVGERLYRTLWQTMRDTLGAEDPDTVAAARPSGESPD